MEEKWKEEEDPEYLRMSTSTQQELSWKSRKPCNVKTANTIHTNKTQKLRDS